MVVSCCNGDQGGQGRRRFAHRLRQRIKSILERYEKFKTWMVGGVESSNILSWLIKRLARCWLEHGDGAAKAAPPPERLLNRFVRLQAYVLMFVTGLGYLSLMWSTVVLLGGFVTVLEANDFAFLTVISMIQAARIFDNLQDDLVIHLLRSVTSIGARMKVFPILYKPTQSIPVLAVMSVAELVYIIVMTPIVLVTEYVFTIFLATPFMCIFLSMVGIGLHVCGSSSEDNSKTNNSGDNSKANKSGDNSKANLTPALYIYYALVLVQGAFYLLWYFNKIVGEEIVRSVCRRCKLCAKWGKDLVSEYHLDTRRTFTKEPASLEHRNLITYAVGLLESESRKEYMSGARVLATFIEQGKDVRSQLLLSRPKIQKLIDTLGWRCIPGDDSCQEIRLLVAKIVADVASNIHLAQLPGAAQCIASLFEDDDDVLPPRENLPVVVTRSGRAAEGRNRNQEEGDQEGQNEMSSIDTEGATYNKLILQGLTILERLASNHHNCRDICNTPGLLSVIMAPIYSDTLIKDIEVSACAEVAYRSFKVMHQLIRTPCWTGRRLRCEISSSNQAVSNLEKIMDPDTEASQELRMGAMEILTEMALDLSINLADETKENLITRQLRIFLAAGEAAMSNPLKAVAGTTLALLSSKSDRNSLYIIRERDDNPDRLTEIMFDGNTNTVYRITAAEVLVNLCTHNMLPEEYVRGTLLPKVLTRMVSSNVEPQQPESSQRNIRNCFQGICGSASHRDDVENQVPNHNIQNQQPAQENEDQILTDGLLEASLSLILLIHDKLIYIDGFDAVFQEKAPADQLVPRLKTIVEENCKGKATSASLRIVKLCGQIAISMMQWQRNRYTAHFRDQEFVESLSKASGIMSNLDSCILVTSTNNLRMRKNARPLLSHIEKEVRDLVS